MTTLEYLGVRVVSGVAGHGTWTPWKHVEVYFAKEQTMHHGVLLMIARSLES